MKPTPTKTQAEVLGLLDGENQLVAWEATPDGRFLASAYVNGRGGAQQWTVRWRTFEVLREAGYILCIFIEGREYPQRRYVISPAGRAAYRAYTEKESVSE